MPRKVEPSDRFGGPAVSLDKAWHLAVVALPDRWYISNVRSRRQGGRWSASATLDGDISGASQSGFGPTPQDALLDLAAKFRRHVA